MKLSLKAFGILLVLSGLYIGMYFLLMRPGFAVDFSKEKIVAPTYFIYTEIKKDPTASEPMYLPSVHWLNTAFSPLDHIFRSKKFFEMARLNADTQK